MKNSIKEYIDLTSKEKDELWEEAVFVFDTNVLLNLYRYSSKTSEALINAFKKLSERIWIPHQVAYEFMKNRCEVIFDLVSKYETFDKAKNTFLDQAKGLSNMKDTDPEIIQLNKSIEDWVEKTKKANLRVMNPNDDGILDDILELFDGKTGSAYTKKEKEDLMKEGEKRYKENVPPGYKDSSKKLSNECDNNAYGDFLVWKQIMEYAKNNHKDIIFVTADQKEDWWYRPKNKTVGPLIELRKEFGEMTNQRFLMYSMNHFMEFYEKKYEQTRIKSVIEELNLLSNQTIYLNDENSETGFEIKLDNDALKNYLQNIMYNKNAKNYINIRNYLNKLNLDDNEFRNLFAIRREEDENDG